MNVRALAGSVGIAALALTACGSKAPTPLSQADWVSQGNAICADSHTKAQAIPQTNALSQVAPNLAASVQIFNDALNKLAALTPPAAYAADTATYIADLRTESTALSAAATQAKTDPKGALAALETLSKSAVQDDALATKIGLTTCAN